MIKFFRQIRQRLLSENKFSKYLLYAIGEIVLVVIGILIALGINSWNNNRINTAKQRDYLMAIKSDLEKQIPIINAFIKGCDSIAKVGGDILEDYYANESFTAIDSLSKKLTLFFYAEKYPAISTAFDELQSTGQLNLIQNELVRSNIISYYQNASDSQVAMSYVTSDIVYGHIYPTLKSSIVLLPENLGIPSAIKNVPSTLKSAMSNKLTDPNSEMELFNTINMRIKAALANKSILEKSGDEALELIDALNEELQLN